MADETRDERPPAGVTPRSGQSRSSRAAASSPAEPRKPRAPRRPRDTPSAAPAAPSPSDQPRAELASSRPVEATPVEATPIEATPIEATPGRVDGRQRATVPLERRTRRGKHAQGRARVVDTSERREQPTEARTHRADEPEVWEHGALPRDTMPTRLPFTPLRNRPLAEQQPEEPPSAGPHEHNWLDEEAGPLVRPYTMTGGRSRPVTSGLSLLTYVEALYAPEADLIHLQPEHRAILGITRTALSIAEVAGRLDLPVGVVRVLVGDLLQENLVSTFEADATINSPDDGILQAVIDGLRAL